MANFFSIFFFLVALLITSMSASAQQRSMEDAMSIARDFLHKSEGIVFDNSSLQTQYAKGNSTVPQKTPYYIINDTVAKGFVIVGGDENMRQVIGYSDKGCYCADSVPAGLSDMLKQYAAEYDYAVANPQTLSNSKSMGVTTVQRSAVLPLVKTGWGQEYPYNKYTPLDGYSRSLTGCVATAMAQVMNYHKYPAKGIGSYSYYSRKNRLYVSESFSSKMYDWDNMLSNYGSSSNYTITQSNAVATLMKSCGVSVGMDYDDNASGAYDVDVPYALINNFGYNPNIQNIYKDYYTEEEWEDMIYNELANKRPILYYGSGYYGGHAFVLDGVDGRGYFHFNWGWENQLDGYFALSSLMPQLGMSFSTGQSMTLYISPEKVGEPEDIFFADRFTPNSIESVSLGTPLETMLTDVWCFSNKTSYIRGKAVTWSIGLGVYNADYKLIASYPIKTSSFESYYGYSSLPLSITPDANVFKNGNVYYLAPIVKAASSASYSRIRTLDAKTDFCKVTVVDGVLMFGDVEISNNFTYEGFNYSINSGTKTVTLERGQYDDNEIQIPSTVKYNGISYTVTDIAANVFDGCSELWNITIPETVVSIGKACFRGCTNLCAITCLATTPPRCFYNETSPFADILEATLYVPSECVSVYRTTDCWKEFCGITSEGTPEIGGSWITHDYLVNPYFDYSPDGVIGWRTTTGAVDNRLNSSIVDGSYASGYAWENWHSAKMAGKMFQTFKADKPGIYTVMIPAFCDVQNSAYVFINGAMKPITSTSFDKTYTVRTYCSAGDISLGILLPSYEPYWAAMDNVELYLLEDEPTPGQTSLVLMEQINASKKFLANYGMPAASKNNLKALIASAEEVLNSNDDIAMQTSCDVLSRNTMQVYDVVIKYSQIGSLLKQINEKLADNSASAETNEEASELYDEVLANYAIGAYDVAGQEIQNVILRLKDVLQRLDIPDSSEASDLDPMDMTSAIVNADLTEFKQGWSDGPWYMRTDIYEYEFYNENYMFQQSIKNLPAGTYCIKMQGFYRPGSLTQAQMLYRKNNDDRTNLKAYLFGSTKSGKVKSYIQPVTSCVSTEPLYDTDYKIATNAYIPNDMDGAYVRFMNGDYTDNYLFIDVKEGETLTLGIESQSFVSEDWTCFKNFRLYYHGTNSSHHSGECSGKYKLTLKCSAADYSESQMYSPGDTIVYPIDLPMKDGKVINWTSMPVVMPQSDKTITGLYYYLGDANGDGKVDAADVEKIMQYFLKANTIKFNSADYNRDGKVTIGDANALINSLK